MSLNVPEKGRKAKLHLILNNGLPLLILVHFCWLLLSVWEFILYMLNKCLFSTDQALKNNSPVSI